MAQERLKELLRVRFRGWWGDVPEIEQSIAEVLSDVRTAGLTANIRRDPLKHRAYMRQYQAERRRAAGVPERRRVLDDTGEHLG